MKHSHFCTKNKLNTLNHLEKILKGFFFRIYIILSKINGGDRNITSIDFCFGPLHWFLLIKIQSHANNQLNICNHLEKNLVATLWQRHKNHKNHKGWKFLTWDKCKNCSIVALWDPTKSWYRLFSSLTNLFFWFVAQNNT